MGSDDLLSIRAERHLSGSLQESLDLSILDMTSTLFADKLCQMQGFLRERRMIDESAVPLGLLPPIRPRSSPSVALLKNETSRLQIAMRCCISQLVRHQIIVAYYL
jgi:hypothetical protein